MTSRARAFAFGAAIVVGIGSGAAGWIGCSSSNEGFEPDAGTMLATSDGGVTLLANDAGATNSGDGSGSVVTSRVRFAHLASELGGVDFCWRASAADPFHGPILQTGSQAVDFDGGASGDDGGYVYGDDGSFEDSGAKDAASYVDAGSITDAGLDASDASAASDAASGSDGSDGSAGSSDSGTFGQMDASSTENEDAGLPPLTYLTVSDDVAIEAAGMVDVIAVEPGTGCTAPLVLSQISLSSTSRTTLMLAGGADTDASGSLGISAYADEIAASDPTLAGVRIVNAALSPVSGALAVSFETNGVDTPITTDVEPRAAASFSAASPMVDALGYASLGTVAGDPGFRLIATATNLTETTGPVPSAPAAGSVHTAFVTDDGAGAFVVLWCDDLLSPSCVAVR